MIDTYNITREVYFPDKPLEYLAISFEKVDFKLLGETLTLYGRDLIFMESVIRDLLALMDNDKKKEEDFWTFFDDGVEEDTGYKLGEVTVVANPEFDPHILYRKQSEEIIILPVNRSTAEPFFISGLLFLSLASWWLGVCTDHPA
jgi:hypothetical protein